MDNPKIIFWNIHGYSNISDIDKIYSKQDILCINETWVDRPTLPYLPSQVTSQHSPATRTAKTGRAKGGIALIYNKNIYNANILGQSHNYIVATISTKNKVFNLITVYFPPDFDSDTIIKETDAALDLVEKFNPHSPIIMGGDFNCRVALLNQLDFPTLDINPSLLHERKSMDPIVSSKAKCLVGLLESNDLVLLNGRTYSDTPAHFTFISPLGKSVNDLVWCSRNGLDLIFDSTVMYIPTSSDHFPVSIYLNYENTHSNNRNEIPINKYKVTWDKEKSTNFLMAMEWKPEVSNVHCNIDKCNKTLISSISETAINLGMTKPIHKYNIKCNKPWYDKECQEKSNQLKTNLRTLKKAGFNESNLTIYKSMKKEYRTLLANKKKTYNDTTIRDLSNARNPIIFWKTINRHRKKNSINNNTPGIESWQNYLNNLFPTSNIALPELFHLNNPDLDRSITFEELTISINKCKEGKAAGTDEINYSFYKHLPQNWLLFICTFFNKIMDTEKVPYNWGELTVTMLYKKGEPSDTANYRPITLVNCISKIFMQILYSRLQTWAEANNLLAEFQSGFRKGRSCTDNIFVLNAIIQLQLNKPKQKLYAIFVDFKGAFDSVDHLLLWVKLQALGISSKLLNIIINFYKIARASIKSAHQHTNFVNVTRGVLQGEVLSPLLFALFINDLENFLLKKGCRGIPINANNEISLLAYADDIVLLVDTPTELRRKLDSLFEYCQQNKLTINANKTKIVVFKKNRCKPKIRSYSFGDDSLEVVDSYNYLGIVFNASGSFSQTAKKAISSANTAAGATLKLIYRTKASTLSVHNKLFDSLVRSIILHAAPIWCLGYLETIEKVQLLFYKKLLLLSPSTPNYAVRLETGRRHISLGIFDALLNWTEKTLSMQNSRYPKQCLLSLRDMSLSKPKNTLNWFKSMEFFFEICNMVKLWKELKIRSLSENHANLLHTYELYLYSRDVEDCMRSSSLQILPHLNMQPIPQKYLNRHNLTHARTLAQLRLISNKYGRIIINNNCYRIAEDTYCPYCNPSSHVDYYHLLATCQRYNHIRIKYFPNYQKSIRDWFVNLIENTNSETKIFITMIEEILHEFDLLSYSYIHS